MAFATEKSSTITGGAVRYLSIFGRKPSPYRTERSIHGTEKGTQVAPGYVADRGRGAVGRGRHARAIAGELDAEEAVRRRSDSFGPPAVFGRNRRLVSRQAPQGGRCEAADRRCPA